MKERSCSLRLEKVRVPVTTLCCWRSGFMLHARRAAVGPGEEPDYRELLINTAQQNLTDGYNENYVIA